MILVTGATSGLGRNAVDDLLARGRALRATGRDATRLAHLRALGVEAHGLDLATAGRDELRTLLRGVHAVWHCAALSAPWGPAAAFEAANVEATRRLAEAAVEAQVPTFVHISTPSIYFDYRARRDIDESFRAARPVNAYAASKLRAEGVIHALAERHPHTRFVVLRPRGLFGPHDRVLLPRILALLRARGGVLPLPGGGRAEMELTYVGNVVQAMHLATRAEGLRSGAVYNVSNQQPVALAELLERLVGDGLGLGLRIRAVPYRVMDAAARLLEAAGRLSGREPAFTRYGVGALHFEMSLSPRRARAELGYRPETTLAEGISLTADWMRRHGLAHGL